MKVLIAVDMEGISGLVNWDQVTPGHAEHERFRHIMTADVNAAVRGAFEGGASEVMVADGHWNSTNILIEELDGRAVLNCGTPSPFSMVEGIDRGVDAAIFVGFHARIGAQNAILDHTWSSMRVQNLFLNGRVTGEIGLNAAVCGHFDVPVLMVSGDQSACAEANEFLGQVSTVAVKEAVGRHAAHCLPLVVAQQKIQETAAVAVKQYLFGQALTPYRLPAPIECVVEFFYSDMADKAMLMPGAARLDGRRVKFTALDMPAAYFAFRSAVTLASR